MKIEWTEPAVDDLAGIRDYIARDSEFYAGKFVGRIIEAVEKLPEMGRRVPEAEEQEGIREILFQNYRIIYRLRSEKVQILSVLHGSRDLTLREPKPWEVS
jgi:toxin ParE1/3/4